MASGAMRGIDAVSSLVNPTVTASLTLGMSSERKQSREASSVARPVIAEAGANMSLAANDTLHLQGTQAWAGGDMRLEGADIFIESAESTYAQSQSSSQMQAGIGVQGSYSAVTGGSGGVTANMAHSRSDEVQTETQNLNATLIAGQSLESHSKHNTTIAGANFHASTAYFNVGGDMHFASPQDTAQGSRTSHHMSANGVLGVKVTPTGFAWDGSKGIGFSAGGGNGASERAWVANQSSIKTVHTQRHRVNGHMQVDAGSIEAINNNLVIDTGTFGYSDKQDYDKSHSTEANVGANLSTNKDGKVQKSTVTGLPVGLNIGGKIENRNREQINRATVGAGTIIIRDEANQQQDMAVLNRDVDAAQEITRNDSAGVELYASTSAIEEVRTGFQGIQGNVEKTAKAFSEFDKTITEVVTSVEPIIRNLISGLIPSKVFTPAEINQISQVVIARNAGDLTDDMIRASCKQSSISPGILEWLIPSAHASLGDPCTIRGLSGKIYSIPHNVGDDCIAVANKAESNSKVQEQVAGIKGFLRICFTLGCAAAAEPLPPRPDLENMPRNPVTIMGPPILPPPPPEPPGPRAPRPPK